MLVKISRSAYSSTVWNVKLDLKFISIVLIQLSVASWEKISSLRRGVYKVKWDSYWATQNSWREGGGRKFSRGHRPGEGGGPIVVSSVRGRLLKYEEMTSKKGKGVSSVKCCREGRHCGLYISFISSLIPLTTVNQWLIRFLIIQVHCLIFNHFVIFLNRIRKELKGRKGFKHSPLLPGIGKGWWGMCLILIIGKITLGRFALYQKPDGSLGILAILSILFVALGKLPKPPVHLQL